MQNLVFHEQQRLKLLQLFVATSILLLACIIFLLKDGVSGWLVLPVAISMTLLGLCLFWIDRRSVAAIRSSELAPREANEGGAQASNVGSGNSKNSGSCCRLDGYACIYIVGIVLGLYFSVMPFFVQIQPSTGSTSIVANPKPVTQQPAQVRPINQMPQAMTPIQRPNLAPMPVMPRTTIPSKNIDVTYNPLSGNRFPDGWFLNNGAVFH